MEAGKTIYLLVVRANGNQVIISTTTPVKADDVVKYAVAKDVILGEIVSVIQTQEGSKLHNWIKEASPYIRERRVIAVCRHDPDALRDSD